MAYRLEEKLPVAAEQVTADFVVTGDHAMGVCVVSEKWQRLIGALKAAEIAVELIAPTAVLALGAMTIDAEHDAVLLTDDRRIELFVIDAGRPVRWHSMAPAGDELIAHLQMCRAGDQVLRVALCGAKTAEMARRVGMIEGLEVVEGDDAVVDAAAVDMAARVLAGKATAYVNLCQGALAAANPIGQLHRATKAAIAAALVLWACTMGAMAWRAHQYQRMTTTSEARQAEIYGKLFDGATPLNIKSRLISEHRSLAGVRQGGPSTLPVAESVLPVVHRTLAALPAQLRFSITQLTVDEDELTIDGRVASHSAAEALASAIGRGTGWRIQPPRTQLLSGGEISFTLHGSRTPGNTSGAEAQARAGR
jgi:hypothetical protein